MKSSVFEETSDIGEVTEAVMVVGGEGENGIKAIILSSICDIILHTCYQLAQVTVL